MTERVLSLFEWPTSLVNGGLAVLLFVMCSFGLAGITHTISVWRFGKLYRRAVFTIIFLTVLAAVLVATLWVRESPWALAFGLSSLIPTWKGRRYMANKSPVQGWLKWRGVGPEASELPWMCTVRVISGDRETAGFIASSDGYIVTSARGLFSFAGQSVILANWERYPAQLVAIEKDVDLAILKIEAPFPLPSSRLRDFFSLSFGQPLFVVGYEPLIEKREAAVWNLEGGRYLQIIYPSVLRTSLVNKGHDWLREEPRYAALIVQGMPALKRGHAGAMVCTKDGGVVGIHCPGIDFRGFVSATGSTMAIDLFRKAGVKRRSSHLWKMTYQRPSPERFGGTAVTSTATFFVRYPSSVNVDPKEAEEWETYLANLGPTIEKLAEVQAVRSVLHLHNGKDDEAEKAAFAALDGGITRLTLATLQELAKQDLSRAEFYAEGLKGLRERVEERPSVCGSEFRMALTKAEFSLRMLAGDFEKAEKAVQATQSDFDYMDRSDEAEALLNRAREAADDPR